MKNYIVAFALLLGSSTGMVAQTKPSSVENEKFVFLNNGTTIGMIVKAVIKADKQRLKLTDQQLPKAKEIITNAVVNYNDGVKKLKASGMNQKKLRTLAIGVEDDKVRAYKAILTPEQYTILVAQHKKVYPESKV
ncbi:hypothetical protein EXU85_16160 [Spirosoma sp. KCTC 42546]|uniref:hypothetical protein n=1 Tax=Spirosoma sp. KCTC 42546 TaxID=2520506 RepID=UPI00115A9CE1|nr:hypothetical protein [Spirosoma sp. KCTC 42546]QDK80058.1 hypothetical protein EXU85_16160 [Spirosoma sp. KCTC 42546]